MEAAALIARISFFPENSGWVSGCIWIKRDQLIQEIKNNTDYGKAYIADPYKRLELNEVNDIPQ